MRLTRQQEKDMYEDHDPPYSYCAYCERDTRDVMQDHGIGAYEYGSQKGVHHQWVTGCAECGEVK